MNVLKSIFKKLFIYFILILLLIFKKIYLSVLSVCNQLRELHQKYHYSLRAHYEKEFFIQLIYGTYKNREYVNDSIAEYASRLYKKNLEQRKPFSESTFLNLLWRHFEGVGDIQEPLRGFKKLENLIRFLEPLEN